eukprot:33814_1
MMILMDGCFRPSMPFMRPLFKFKPFYCRSPIIELLSAITVVIGVHQPSTSFLENILHSPAIAIFSPRQTQTEPSQWVKASHQERNYVNNIAKLKWTLLVDEVNAYMPTEEFKFN